MRHLGLHPKLVQFIRDGTLEDEVAKAYAEWTSMNERMDAWEAARPVIARRLPWFEARQAWKDAGRPLPPWYEVLHLLERGSPFKGNEHLLAWPYPPEHAKRHRVNSARNHNAYYWREKAKRKAREEP